jgi:predicted kinase
MMNRRQLIAVGGLIASGKSTVAREVAKLLDADHLEADVVRDELLGIGPDQAAHEAAWAENMATGLTARIYAEMLGRARMLRHGPCAIVVDGCFARREHRLAARALARDADRPFTFVECVVPSGTLTERLQARSQHAGVAEDAWLELLTHLQERWEPVVELPGDEHLIVDCTRPLDESVESVLDLIAARRENALRAS